MRTEPFFLRILISIMLFLVVLLIGHFISDYVFYSCPVRASATTDACIDSHIDEVYDTILIIRLVLLIPMTFFLSIIVFKNTDATKLLHRLKILTVVVAGLFLVSSIERHT